MGSARTCDRFPTAAFRAMVPAGCTSPDDGLCRRLFLQFSGPTADSTHVDDVLISHFLQIVAGLPTARSAETVHEKRRADGTEFSDGELDIRQRDIDGAGQMPLLVFFSVPNIYKDGSTRVAGFLCVIVDIFFAEQNKILLCFYPANYDGRR